MEHTLIHRVQFSETDMAGVVHFSNYFKWMEEVEHAFFRSIGLSVIMPQDGAHLSWPRVAASCDYQGPVRFEDEIELRLKITRVGEKSLAYEVRFLKDGKPVALGKITAVCVLVSDTGFQAIAIPPELRARLQTPKKD